MSPRDDQADDSADVTETGRADKSLSERPAERPIQPADPAANPAAAPPVDQAATPPATQPAKPRPARPALGLTGTTLDAAMLQAVLDATPARVVVVNREHRFLFANREALQFFGARAEQIIGRPLRDVIGASYESTYVALHETLFERGESVRNEGWVEYPVHGRLYVQQMFLPHAPAGGPVQAVFVFIRDLTELKTREAELSAKVAQLQEAEALKSAIFDHALAAMVSSDAQGRVAEFNPAAEAMFGHRRAAVIGQVVADVLFPQRMRQAHRAGLEALRQGQAEQHLGQRIEMAALHADGHEFPVEIVFWRSQVGQAEYYTATLVDLTERRAAAAEIARQRDALRQSEKLSAMGSLLAGVAHELNNPLAIVMGRATLLQDKTEGTPLADDANRIHEAAARCGRIVRTFLDMARNKPLAMTAVQLNELVRGAADLLQHGLRSGDVQVDLFLAPDLPTVQADADRLGQVVLNLMINAQQALAEAPRPRRLRISTGARGAAPGKVPVHIDLSAMLAGAEPGLAGASSGEVWLQISDSGAGVPEALRERIFDPYFTTKPGGTGTGLGLAVSRAVARELGGELRLEPSAAGACFVLSLPLSEPVPFDAAPAPVVAAAPAVLAPTTVLVIDDEPEIAELIEAMLSSAGFEVECAGSAALALQAIARRPPQAIVCDLRMPDMDGTALWRQVRQRWPALARRMVFVTGDALSAGARQFFVESGCASLDKPFAKPELLAALRGALAAADSA